MDQDQLIEMIKQIARETVEEYLNGGEQQDQQDQQEQPEQTEEPAPPENKKKKQNGRRTDTGQVPDQINTDVQYSQYN